MLGLVLRLSMPPSRMLDSLFDALSFKHLCFSVSKIVLVCGLCVCICYPSGDWVYIRRLYLAKRSFIYSLFHMLCCFKCSSRDHF
jgi:hypothetical protein